MASARHFAALAVAACLAASLQLSAGVGPLGPFGNAPLNTATCPSACKVRDISIVGSGVVVAAANADACIKTCRAKGKSHYSWAQPSRMCSCGKCVGGFTPMSKSSQVISGSTAACVKQAACSGFFRKSQSFSCPATATKVAGTGGRKNFVRCCCNAPNTNPVVMGGMLVSCSATGV